MVVASSPRWLHSVQILQDLDDLKSTYHDDHIQNDEEVLLEMPTYRVHVLATLYIEWLIYSRAKQTIWVHGDLELDSR